MSEETTETPTSGSINQSEGTPPSETTQDITDFETPSHLQRTAFSDIRRQISDEELREPGAQKLILQILEDTEIRLTDAKSFIDRFHKADKEVGVLKV